MRDDDEVPLEYVVIRCPRCDGSGVYNNAHFRTYDANVCHSCSGTGQYESVTVVPAGRKTEGVPASSEDTGPVDTLLTMTEVTAVNLWRLDHPDRYTYPRFLRQFEPDRFRKAVRSIVGGRGQAVADALEPWYLEFRTQNGWEPIASDRE